MFCNAALMSKGGAEEQSVVILRWLVQIAKVVDLDYVTDVLDGLDLFF